jgi:hypothetical protein
MSAVHIAGGVKAALVAVGVASGAAMPTAPQTPHHAQVAQTAPMTQKAILMQIDHRLGVIKQTQQTMLKGYETGGIYR